jgi:chitosanase
MRRLSLGCVALLLAACAAAGGAACGSQPWPVGAKGPSTIALTAQQRNLADQLVNVFEYGGPAPRYTAVEALGDGRGYTCGKIGFTTSSREVLTAVEAYVAKVPDSRLGRHLPRLRELAERGSGDTAGLSGFPEDWAAAAQDPAFRAEQDALADRLTFNPALESARRLGIRTPLGVAVLYDTAVQHGTAEDPDGLPALIERATRETKGEPATGVAEQTWLEAFLDARAETLRHAHNPDTRAVWAESVDRADALRDLVNTDRHQLEPPLKITVFGDEHELR